MPRGMAWVATIELVRRRWRAGARPFALALAVSLFVHQPLAAETLAEALATAYRENPRLDAERARLRATDEDVSRALSGYRPQIGASAEISHETRSSRPSLRTDGASDPWAYQISISQPVFSGFTTTNQVSEAEASVRAGRENLRRAEADTLLAAVEAYVDVVRDSAILRIRERNVDVLSQELNAAEERRAARARCPRPTARAPISRYRGRGIGRWSVICPTRSPARRCATKPCPSP